MIKWFASVEEVLWFVSGEEMVCLQVVRRRFICEW